MMPVPQLVHGSRLAVWRPELRVWHVDIAVASRLGWAVIHNQKGVGVIWSTFEEFAESKAIYVQDRPNSDAALQRVAVAIQLIGRKYYIVTFNCEHYMNFVCGQGSRSPQLQGALAGPLLIVGLAAVGTPGVTHRATLHRNITE